MLEALNESALWCGPPPSAVIFERLKAPSRGRGEARLGIGLGPVDQFRAERAKHRTRAARAGRPGLLFL